jgi:uncharacterized protein YukE
MKVFRRILGILVMIAGLLGLILSAAGLVGLWMVKPDVTSALGATISTLNNSLKTSQQVMQVTQQALGATVDSVDALSVMLSSTATSVQDTTPAVQKVNLIIGVNLPDTLRSATTSLESAQQAAAVLDSSIQSLQAFQTAMGSVPLVSAFVQQPSQPYNPDKPLAESLGDVADQLKNLPDMFVDLSQDLGKADDNLATIQSSLTTMSNSVKGISESLSEYQAMVTQSETSMTNLTQVLTNFQDNLTPLVNGAVWVLTLFLVWLLVIQVVILSQGWELFQGTAGRMEAPAANQPE